MSTTYPASAGGRALPEKKRKFSLFRSRPSETIVTIHPANDDRRGEHGRPRAHTLPVTSMYPESSTSTESSTPTEASSPASCAPSSIYSVPSTSADTLSQAPVSSVGPVLDDSRTTGILSTDSLPTYARATNITQATTYVFKRCSPFAMLVVYEAQEMEGQALYRLSVGVNVWMPSMTVTTVTRGSSEDGPPVATVELGISSEPATVTIGNVSRQLNQIYFRKSTASSSRLYFLGDGRTMKWKMGSTSWQAHFGTTLLATFIPTTPQKLTLEPAGHRVSDHIVVSLVILMREYLTPLAGLRGESASLFNYSPHYNYRDE